MLKYLICSILIYFAFAKAMLAQTEATKEYRVQTVAFYNLENLFDTVDDVTLNDEASPMMELDPGIREEVYDKKLTNMARVIRKLGAEKSESAPAIVGVCEVENRKVLVDLVNHPLLKEFDYGIEHFESPDRRGIDTGFVYRKSEFRILNAASKELFIYDTEDGHRIYTRSPIIVTGELNGDKMTFIVNHWPSRSGGEQKSRSKRNAAAALNKAIVDSLHSIDAMSKIFIMGDFNDDPTNESLKDILKAERDREKIRPQMIYNPYSQMHKDGYNTLAYRDSGNLFDQITFTYPLLQEAQQTGYKYWQAHIYNPGFLTNKTGRYKGYPHRSFIGNVFADGYSDHFPVFVYLVREIKTGKK
ncbi:endonuclease/exonuclease/phosphatase family protein [Nonlabens antarcticus]|uniref:endonuclease/exonuclease/phosphatase family protein n=1 Tax=Nonlabens antarcticus TaxID=392714 RepID=UPI001891722C|nr:endonuclease/exonuclease/phosphatase family protein [Nonlabens antarcticus]